jgi:2,3-bisphosphoglycerate-independent phosphoglycerate mutase
VAERWSCPEAQSPLARAEAGNLGRLAEEGRVFGVALLDGGAPADSAAPLLALLGHDPAHAETAAASYLGALHEAPLGAGECWVSAHFVSIFRDLLADAEPALRPQETDVLLAVANEALARTGVRVLAGEGARHVAAAPRAAIDAKTPPPAARIGSRLAECEPRVEMHAVAHRLGRDALDGHEVNVVRRDLGGNGADMLWLFGPGGPARLPPPRTPASALGADPLWRGVCKVAGTRAVRRQAVLRL